MKAQTISLTHRIREHILKPLSSAQRLDFKENVSGCYSKRVVTVLGAHLGVRRSHLFYTRITWWLPLCCSKIPSRRTPHIHFQPQQSLLYCSAWPELPFHALSPPPLKRQHEQKQNPAPSPTLNLTIAKTTRQSKEKEKKREEPSHLGYTQPTHTQTTHTQTSPSVSMILLWSSHLWTHSPAIPALMAKVSVIHAQSVVPLCGRWCDVMWWDEKIGYKEGVRWQPTP